eukprot:jgi/Bigna1/91898/estExt_fgenesh1_pg.C_1280028
MQHIRTIMTFLKLMELMALVVILSKTSTNMDQQSSKNSPSSSNLPMEQEGGVRRKEASSSSSSPSSFDQNEEDDERHEIDVDKDMSMWGGDFWEEIGNIRDDFMRVSIKSFLWYEQHQKEVKQISHKLGAEFLAQLVKAVAALGMASSLYAKQTASCPPPSSSLPSPAVPAIDGGKSYYSNEDGEAIITTNDQSVGDWRDRGTAGIAANLTDIAIVTNYANSLQYTNMTATLLESNEDTDDSNVPMIYRDHPVLVNADGYDFLTHHHGGTESDIEAVERGQRVVAALSAFSYNCEYAAWGTKDLEEPALCERIRDFLSWIYNIAWEQYAAASAASVSTSSSLKTERNHSSIPTEAALLQTLNTISTFFGATGYSLPGANRTASDLLRAQKATIIQWRRLQKEWKVGGFRHNHRKNMYRGESLAHVVFALESYLALQACILPGGPCGLLGPVLREDEGGDQETAASTTKLLVKDRNVTTLDFPLRLTAARSSGSKHAASDVRRAERGPS